MRNHSLVTVLKSTLVAGLALVLAACSSAAASTISPTAAISSTITPGAASSTIAAGSTSAASSTSVPGATTAKINLNTATAEQILTVPNAGQRMVRESQEYRPYATILAFRREIGKYVDAATVAAYEQYVYVPVDFNQADTETLKQLPGVTDTIAASLIAARPYASADAFLTKLGSVVAADQVTLAKSYLTGA